jgi:hypothetical protein
MQTENIVQNEFIVVKNSKIHKRGVFAKKDIPKGMKIIEYVGKKITKSESEKLAEKQLEKSKNHTEEGGVYIFELNKKYDIDGKVPWNPAQFINHSCLPNSEADIVRGHIWITALKKIKKGDEITYNYGYDFKNYKEHPCACGSENCIGFIAAEEHWKKIKKTENKK